MLANHIAGRWSKMLTEGLRPSSAARTEPWASCCPWTRLTFRPS